MVIVIVIIRLWTRSDIKDRYFIVLQKKNIIPNTNKRLGKNNSKAPNLIIPTVNKKRNSNHIVFDNGTQDVNKNNNDINTTNAIKMKKDDLNKNNSHPNKKSKR